ncbi:aminotransferase class IV [Longirhabdus pacifica]|uniref:aminotransferase class IV n=1 Tax=Longirhabdus pacifica TaxID=2305227 RepID=UPI001008861F|nr:aminotransferase class IV [Longirhabdus pacifica]
MVVFAQGKFVPEEKTKISIRSSSVNFGLGILEGIRAFWNPVQQLLKATIDLLRINKIRENIYIRPLCLVDETATALRLFDSNNVVYIYLSSVRYGEDELNICISSWVRNQTNAIPTDAKSTAGYMNSALAASNARLSGFDDAIFLDAAGNVAEGTGTNVFIVIGRTLITPPVSDDIVNGITRDTIITMAKHSLGINTVQRSMDRTELYTADEVFISGTAAGIKSIVKIDHRTIGTGKKGIITSNIQKLYQNIVSGNAPQYSNYLTPVYT